MAARTRADDVRIVYFMLASRQSAPAMLSRAVRALYHPSHLFLFHVDLKANASTHEALVAYAAQKPNLHVLKTRRLVQWGGFSMVSVLLDAISSFVKRVDFDFFINLSDADLVLRTNEELSGFLRGFKGRTFMRIDEALQSTRTAKQRSDGDGLTAEVWDHTVIECGGFGFVSVNSSANLTPTQPYGGRTCCLGQSGPLLHAALPFTAPLPHPPTFGEFRGSQWSILSSSFCKHLLVDAAALQWARVLERRLLPDELYLPTVI